MAILSVRSSSAIEHLARVLGVLLVLVLTVWAFWANSKRHTERLNAQFGIADADKRLSEAEYAQVQAFITDLRQRYGIEARVQVTREAPAPPASMASGSAERAKTLFVGISPETGKALVLLPPLVERALGPEFAPRLVNEHFPFHMAPGKSWQKGLLLALDLIQLRLAALAAEPEAATSETATPKTSTPVQTSISQAGNTKETHVK